MPWPCFACLMCGYAFRVDHTLQALAKLVSLGTNLADVVAGLRGGLTVQLVHKMLSRHISFQVSLCLPVGPPVKGTRPPTTACHTHNCPPGRRVAFASSRLHCSKGPTCDKHLFTTHLRRW